MPSGPASASATMRYVFIGAALCWNVSAVVIGILMGLYALPHNKAAGLLSITFGVVTAIQGILGFMKLKQSVNRYVRFGLNSATFSRTPARLGIAWLAATLVGMLVYAADLVFFISASSSADADEALVGQRGVVWYTILGVTMLSLLLGIVVVSRITPYLSSYFIQTPAIAREDSSSD